MMVNRFSKIINLIILLSIIVAGLFLFPIFEASYTDVAKFIPFIKSVGPENRQNINPLPLIAPSDSSLNLLFFGDLMLDRNVGAKLKNRNMDFLLGELASSTDFDKFDLVGANLEGAVINQGKHYAPEMGFDFSFLPEHINDLKKYNFTYFSLANNHITDQGSRGLKETRENLSALGFNYSGEADAQVSTSSLKIIELKNKKVALVAFSMVFHNFNLDQAQKIISSARQEADWVIVNIHWGSEYQHNYNDNQKKVGRALIDSGADIIIGHHPHVVQGMEVYKNRPIFYSLGNFIFDQYFSPDTQEELSLKINLSDDKISIGLQALSSRGSAISLMADSKTKKFLENFALWSKADSILKEQIMSQTINIAKER